MITIKGILARLTYQNPENHYTIARLGIHGISDSVTIVGYLAGVVEGETLEVSGQWVSHPKYGDQFKIEGYKVMLPATVSGIKKYLGSGMIKGIGKSLADKIVTHFQENTLVIIENEPDKLIAARKGSPLVVGIGNDEYFIASDATPIVEHTKSVIYLNDDNVAIISRNELTFKTMEHLFFMLLQFFKPMAPMPWRFCKMILILLQKISLT